MNKIELEKLINSKAEAIMLKDPDVSKYTGTSTLIIDELFKACEFKENNERHEPTLWFLTQFATFTQWGPGGSKSDYIASNVVRAFEGLEITSIKQEWFDKMESRIHDKAIHPQRELNYLNCTHYLLVD